MFDFIRNHQRLMQFLLLLLILPSFAFFGLESYSRFQNSDQGVAKVGGQPITQQELDNAQREQLQRMQQMFGASVDPKMLDTPQARLQTLEGLIAQRAIANEAVRARLMVTDDSLRETIMAIPAVQNQGAFDNERYKTLLAAQGMTPAVFESRLRQDLVLQQVGGIMQESAFLPKTIATRTAAIVDQQRDVEQLEFKPADYVARVKLPADALQQYYDGHPKEFEIPEQVKVEYLTLSADAVAGQIAVPPDAVADYYKQNVKRYETGEQRRASHILISVAKDAKDADKQKAKAKAEDVLAKVRAIKGDAAAEFAKLAKQYSDDPGSAEKGGDLDYFGHGAMVPQFDDAAFKLKVKEISGLVQSDFGYHIIMVTDIRPSVVKTVDEVRGQIETEIRKQLATKKFAEAAELFTNSVYDQSDSLKPAADKLKLTIQTASGITRTPAPTADPKSPFSNPKLLTALFGDDAVKNKRNTEAVEVAPSTLVSARVVEYKPATRRPFAEVSDAVKAKVTDMEARKLARQDGAARLAELQKGATVDGFGPARTISRNTAPDIAADAVPLIFKTDTSKLPAYTGVELASGGYAIYRITKVTQPDKIDAAQRATLAQNLARQTGDLEFAGYLAELNKRARVKLMQPYADIKAGLKTDAPVSTEAAK